MVFAALRYKPFFRRRPEVVNPGILTGEVQGTASVMEDV
jgi:hypothetical protein